MTAQRGDSAQAEPSPEKPTCAEWTAHGHCIRDEGHEGQHMPLPRQYPPRRLPEHLRIDTVNDYPRQKGEIA